MSGGNPRHGGLALGLVAKFFAEIRTKMPASVKRRVPRFIKRLVIVVSFSRYARRRPSATLAYLAKGRELANFTYEIANRESLVMAIAEAMGTDPARVSNLIAELENDQELARLLANRLTSRRDREHAAHYGRRLGWYAMVRLTMPRVVVETGVHDGLGSSVLLRALEANAHEGTDGFLYGFDIDPSTGWLIPTELRSRFILSIGDSVDLLPKVMAETEIDVFIHDSEHTYAHEMSEYETCTAIFSANALLVSDNAHAEPALEDFSRQHGRRFHFWREQSKGHFYPGAGIGISIRA